MKNKTLAKRTTALLSVSFNGEVKGWDGDATFLFGYKPEEVKGKLINEVFPEFDVDAHLPKGVSAAAAEIVLTGKVKNGTQQQFMFKVIGVNHTSGNVLCTATLNLQ